MTLTSTHRTGFRHERPAYELETRSGNERVRWVQTILREAAGERALGVDGRSGGQTRAALTRFQRSYGLLERGKAGKLTSRTGNGLIKVALERIYRRRIPVGPGSMNSALRDATRVFQRAYKLGADGKVGPTTRRVMVEVLSGRRRSPLRNHHYVLGPGVSQPGAGDREIALDAGRGVEREVFGTDARKRVTSISKIDRVPFRWICALTVSFPDPDDASRVVKFDDGGSGLLIGSRHVLTAAHNVFAEVTGSRGTKKKQWADKVVVSPGRDGAKRPFGRSEVASQRVAPGFRPDLDARFDYALLKLKSALGSKKFKRLGNRTLGFWGSASRGGGTQVGAVDRAKLAGKIVNVAGYPKGKGVTQWLAFDKVKDHHPTVGGTAVDQLFTHVVDTTVGQSGSPVWRFTKSSGRRDLVGVHRGGCLAVLDGCLSAGGAVTSNMAVLLTQDVIDQIDDWKRTM